MKLKTIQVSVETWKRLKMIQIENQETMDELVTRMLKVFKNHEKPVIVKSQFGKIKHSDTAF